MRVTRHLHLEIFYWRVFGGIMILLVRVQDLEGLWTLINKLRLSARATRNTILVELPILKRAFGSEPAIYSVPMFFENPIYIINLVEKGGGRKKTGEATVVCGFSGKKLRPYRIPREMIKMREHAFFSVPELAVTVTATRNPENLLIQTHSVNLDAGIAWIYSSTEYSGLFSELPEHLLKFKAAALAAMEKAACPGCQHVHFARQ